MFGKHKPHIDELTVCNIISGHRIIKEKWQKEIDGLKRRLANAELQLKIAEFICDKLDESFKKTD
jgi:hypothetical protein